MTDAPSLSSHSRVEQHLTDRPSVALAAREHKKNDESGSATASGVTHQ